MRFIQLRLVGPAIIGVALLIAGLATIPYFAVARIDAEARERQEKLVSGNVGLWIKDIEFSLTAWTVWDEAIANLDNKFNFDWADRNMGASLIGTSRTRFAAVLDPSNAMFYSRTDESVQRNGFFTRGATAIVADASSLVDEVRRREQESRKAGIPDQLANSRIEVLGDEAVLLTAALFQPDFGTAKLKGDRAPVLVTAMPIAGSLQSFFGSRFLLDDPHLSLLSEVTSDRARADIAVGADGRPVVLSWRSPTPAADMMRQSLPFIVAVGVSLVAFAVFALRVSQTAAQALVGREQEMRYAATHDFLTGLANRSRLDAEYMRLRAQGPLAVVCLDLDGFKTVNDTYGHAAGDALLQAVAGRLKQGARKGDRLFRLGGDEFAIFMPQTLPEDAVRLCQSLGRLLYQPFDLPTCQVTIGASFGVQHVSDDAVTSEAALKAADMALYEVKSARRGGMASLPGDIRQAAAPVRRRVSKAS
ncbi:diguanylate cyclase [Neorhizobium lilium]|uniref:Diguanylate cyclase n=1 Tax=Neorhizobium lilium TaxID=2503024 RepID=A0A3S4UQF3_9HYPH|nr:diguanylate cyclase [Neorhizobium lilium]RWX78707.1 diguanylate cyclase [Neorhizobium lilium]